MMVLCLPGASGGAIVRFASDFGLYRCVEARRWTWCVILSTVVNAEGVGHLEESRPGMLAQHLRRVGLQVEVVPLFVDQSMAQAKLSIHPKRTLHPLPTHLGLRNSGGPARLISKQGNRQWQLALSSGSTIPRATALSLRTTAAMTSSRIFPRFRLKASRPCRTVKR